ncbi:DDB1- and CUL4-associated factor 10 homolog [Nilaparvata lugens]|uniref:DDB1- and CUL4-associated factor 10 homolog n=1 Tax=Nilaparvata lugens TaxID=108931 RepID=UPI00193D15C5|nr:DDB1- and CUL4-associated factor 10 homolog [Nilaparvata lugens]
MDIFNILNKPTTSHVPAARGPVFDKKWIRNRELGFKPKVGTQDKFMNCLYSSVMPCSTWDHNSSVKSAVPGGIFNLEFSPDGSMLVAACEKKSILMFDPLSRNLIRAIDNAHNDCVNCVRFLDSRVFATCSDDNTVALWDARNLKSRIRTLHGHSNWVKNIEFSPNDGLLVTSGFDGSIFTWDINSYPESQYSYNRVFHTNGLMRTRLNHDASKMIICTTGGYLIIIHNLDLKTLEQDMIGFKPNMYRLMQLSQTTIPVVACYTRLFSRHRKTNRLEFITDFPEGDEAEVVSSLQVHPEGWCALSRNINNDESTEWTCIHDIQEREPDSAAAADESDADADEQDDSSSDEEDDISGSPEACATDDGGESGGGGGSGARADAEREREFARRRARSASGSAYLFRGFPSADAGDAASGNPSASANLSPINTDIWEALVAIREVRSQRERQRRDAEHRAANGGVEMTLNSALETRMRVVRMTSGLPADSNGAGYFRSSETVFPETSHRRILRRRPATGHSVNIHYYTWACCRSQRERQRRDAEHRAANGGVEMTLNSALETRMRVVRMTSGLPADSNGAGYFRSSETVFPETSHRRILRRRPATGSDANNSREHSRERSRASDSAANSDSAPQQPRVTTITYNFMRYGRRRRYRQDRSGSGGDSGNGSGDYDLGAGSLTRVRSHAVVILGGSGTGSATGGRRLHQVMVSPFGSYRSEKKLMRRHKIHQNVPRLTHYIQEPNLGKGFIKELCFSSDGRLICSPFGYGVRLLAFSPNCSELSACVPATEQQQAPPVKLHEVGTNICHSDIVVSTKFSPRHCLLVSGCLSGRIVWHQPVIQQ